MKTYKENIQRRLERFKSRLENLSETHMNKELTVYNYYAGREVGVLEGKISILEDIIDDLDDNIIKEIKNVDR